MAISSPSVLVIGGGPIGLTLAGDLGGRGVSCLLDESGDGTVAQPKMDMVGVRSMEFCRRWGIVDWVHAAGYNRDYPQDCAWATSLNGYEFGREPFPPPAQERPPAQSPQKREPCAQNFHDRGHRGAGGAHIVGAGAGARDVITTGTPEGVGSFAVGDELRIEIESVGGMTLPVREHEHRAPRLY